METQNAVETPEERKRRLGSATAAEEKSCKTKQNS